MAHQSIRATLHVGPFVGLFRVAWNATIGRITVGQEGADGSLHLFPDAAYALAAELIEAADQATGMRRNYDVRRLVAANELDRYASADALVDQLADQPDTVGGALAKLSREGKL